MIVSIPSFRDPNVIWTVRNCIERATFKDTLVIVVCEQNKDEPSCQDMIEWADSLGVLLIVETIHWTEAQGPCWARRRIEKRIQSLWETRLSMDPRHADEHILMVDAHTLFAENWDSIAKEEIRRHPANAILTCYPRPYRSTGTQSMPIWNTDTKTLYMDLNGFEENGLFLFKYAFSTQTPQDLIVSKGLGACMLLLPVQILYEVPYLEHVPYLFIGEETMMWCRYLEAGYIAYNPSKDIVQTTFSRQGRANFHAMSKREKLQRHAQAGSIAKVKRYLNMGVSSLQDEGEWAEFLEVNLPKIRINTVTDFNAMVRWMQRTRGMIGHKQLMNAFPKLKQSLVSFRG